MKVVIDCANGAAGQLGPILLKTLGCEVIELFCDIDGSFPESSSGSQCNRKTMSRSRPPCVFNMAPMLAIAFDGDGDRLGIVDSKGKSDFSRSANDDFLPAKYWQENPAPKIIYDVKCSKHLHNEIIKRGGQPIMWKTGHSLIKAKIKETGAALAGEISGHIFFNDRWFGFDDALYASGAYDPDSFRGQPIQP